MVESRGNHRADIDDQRLAALAVANSVRYKIADLSWAIRSQRSDSSVSPTESAVLALVFVEQLTPKRIGELEQLRPTSVSRVLRNLEAHDLIRRTRHPVDARQTLVAITELGREMVIADRILRDRWLADKVERLSADDQQTLLRAATLLDRITSE